MLDRSDPVNKGWQRGTRWAYEVRAPQAVDCTIGIPEKTQPLREWLDFLLGVCDPADRQWPAA